MNKKLITALVAVAAVLALSFCLAACGDDGTQPGGGEGGEGGSIAHKISVDARTMSKLRRAPYRRPQASQSRSRSSFRRGRS